MPCPQHRTPPPSPEPTPCRPPPPAEPFSPPRPRSAEPSWWAARPSRPRPPPRTRPPRPLSRCTPPPTAGTPSSTTPICTGRSCRGPGTRARTWATGRLGSGIYAEPGAETTAIRFDVQHSEVQDHRPEYGSLFGLARLPIGHFTLEPAGTITGIDWRMRLRTAELQGTVTTSAGTLTLRAFIQSTGDVLVRGAGDGVRAAASALPETVALSGGRGRVEPDVLPLGSDGGAARPAVDTGRLDGEELPVETRVAAAHRLVPGLFVHDTVQLGGVAHRLSRGFRTPPRAPPASAPGRASPPWRPGPRPPCASSRDGARSGPGHRSWRRCAGSRAAACGSCPCGARAAIRP